MKWRVLISAPYLQAHLERFKPLLTEHGIEPIVPPVRERLEADELLHWVRDVDGAICGDDGFTEEVLRSAPRLKVISKWGTGIDSIDRDTCRRLGIVVRNTPNAFSEPVADTVLGYVLCFARQLPTMDRAVRAGFWAKMPARALRECTLGVIGVGNVGKAVVRRAVGFGMNVLGNDLVGMPLKFLADTGMRMAGKEELLATADFVSLNCDLNPTSYHLLDEARLALMKPTAVVINTARGHIVDEKALVSALLERRIAGAGLDVFEEEPLPEDSPLRRMDHVMLASHNANASPEAWESVHWNTIRNLIEVLRSQEMLESP